MALRLAESLAGIREPTAPTLRAGLASGSRYGGASGGGGDPQRQRQRRRQRERDRNRQPDRVDGGGGGGGSPTDPIDPIDMGGFSFDGSEIAAGADRQAARRSARQGYRQEQRRGQRKERRLDERLANQWQNRGYADVFGEDPLFDITGAGFAPPEGATDPFVIDPALLEWLRNPNDQGNFGTNPEMAHAVAQMVRGWNRNNPYVSGLDEGTILHRLRALAGNRPGNPQTSAMDLFTPGGEYHQTWSGNETGPGSFMDGGPGQFPSSGAGGGAGGGGGGGGGIPAGFGGPGGAGGGGMIDMVPDGSGGWVPLPSAGGSDSTPYPTSPGQTGVPVGQDPLSQWIQGTLMGVMENAGADPSGLGGSVTDHIMQLLAGGGQIPGNDPFALREESLRESLERMRASQMDTLEGELLSRGLKSIPGIPQGAERRGLQELTRDLAGIQATALRDYAADTAGQESDQYMQALGLGGGMSQNNVSNMLKAAGLGGQYQGTIGQLALGNLEQNRLWNSFLAQFGLDRQTAQYMIQSGMMDQLLQVMGMQLQGAGTAAGGYF